jgi:hypothetical protein
MQWQGWCQWDGIYSGISPHLKNSILPTQSGDGGILNPYGVCAMFAARRGVQTEMNREIRCFDNRPDISAHLLHPHNTVPGHRLEGTGKVAAAPSRRRFQFLERFRFPLQDGFQQQLVLDQTTRLQNGYNRSSGKKRLQP